MGFYHNNTFFDASEARSKHYYNLLIQLKATLSNGAKRLQDKFTFTREDLSEIYLLPINVCMETYLRDFQYKVLNYTTCKKILLKKLGKVDSDVCSFCNFSREDLEHLLFFCPASQFFWNDFRLFWYDVMKEDITLSLKDIVVGVSGNSHVLLNYCILVGKSFIFHCKKNNTKPTISSFKVLLTKKYQVELYIAGKNKKLNDFYKKWKFMPLT